MPRENAARLQARIARSAENADGGGLHGGAQNSRVDAAAAMKVKSYEAPPVRKAGARVASVDELVAKLHDEAKVI